MKGNVQTGSKKCQKVFQILLYLYLTLDIDLPDLSNKPNGWNVAETLLFYGRWAQFSTLSIHFSHAFLPGFHSHLSFCMPLADVM